MNQFLFWKGAPSYKKLLMLKAASGGSASEYTATGNPLSFNTNLAKPLKSLTIPFTPTQSGTGDPSPTNVRPISGVSAVNVWRTGKNIFPTENLTRAYIDSSGRYVSNNNNIITDYIPYTYGTKVTTYMEDNPSGKFISSSVVYYDSNKTFLVRESYGSKSTPYVFNGYQGTGNGYIRISINRDDTNHTVEEFVAFGLYAQFGDDFAAYSPYTGQSYNITFPALGKNLYDVATYPLTEGNFIYGTNGEVGTNANYSCTLDYVPCSAFAGQTVTLNKRSRGSSPGVAFYDADKHFISGQTNNDGTQGTPLAFAVPVDAVYLRFSTIPDATEIQIEKGNQATPYEPYTNTVYGGSLDVTTGVLTVEWNGFRKTWGDGTSATDMGSGITRKAFTKIANYTTGGANNMCNVALYASSENADVHFYYAGSGNCRIFLPSDTPDSTEIVVISKLSQSYTVQLSPTQITALLGDNTIWSDTNGSNTAVYLKKG